MRASEQAIELIKTFEGLRTHPYLCPSGVPTIGYGHTAGVTLATPPITSQRAVELLREDLARFEKAVEDAIRIPLTQYEFDALVSFVLNVGISAFRTSMLVRHLNAGDRAAAAAEFDRWNKGRVGGQLIPLTGLALRRTAERRLFEGRAGK